MDDRRRAGFAVADGGLGAYGALATLAVFSIYSIAAPLACGLGRRWWRQTLLSGTVWILTFIAIGALSNLTGFGEGAMVFVLPVMIYPVALGAVIRLVRWRTGEVRAPAEAP